MAAHVLTVNGGSSSIKFAVFAAGDPPSRLLAGIVERICLSDAVLVSKGGAGHPEERLAIGAADHQQAVAALLNWLDQRIGLANVAAVGHRVVHGGEHYAQSTWVDDELMAELRRLSPLDPAHLPGEITLIEAFTERRPNLKQAACFDTAFHHGLPHVASHLPIPRRYAAQGIRRYGFHGLSYAYLMEELERLAGAAAARGRIVLAHLGSGASMAAVRDGKCIDTTMSLTPTAGLVMGTRSGDLDPGLLIYLLRDEGLTVDQVDDLVNRRSGLLGISETSPDMRDLLAREASDPRAAEAVAIFCYQAKKWIGAYAAALGGLDALVFAGGVGENSPPVRSRICNGLEFLGIRLDANRNAAADAVISTDKSNVVVRVIRTDEESMIAKELYRLINAA